MYAIIPEVFELIQNNTSRFVPVSLKRNKSIADNTQYIPRVYDYKMPVAMEEEDVSIGEELREKISFICSNKKNVKHISEYLKEVEEGSEEPIPLLTGVFSFYIRDKTWVGVSAPPHDEVTTDPKRKREIAEIKVNMWLHAAYKSYVKILLELLRSETSRQLTYFQVLIE